MSRYKKEIVKHLSALMQEGPIEENKNYIQHGDVTVFEHCIAVAEYSCRIAEFLHLSVNRKVLIRGALLHDYFCMTGIIRTTVIGCMGFLILIHH